MYLLNMLTCESSEDVVQKTASDYESQTACLVCGAVMHLVLPYASIGGCFDVTTAHCRAPRLLICDEATSALDTATEQGIMGSLDVSSSSLV